MTEIITAQGYPYGIGEPGEIVEWKDGRSFICAYFDAGTLSPATALKGAALAISYDTGDTLRQPIAIAVGTLAVYRYIGVTLQAITAAGWYWMQIAGEVDALVEGTSDVAKGDYLEVLNTEDSFKKDHATVRSVNSVAVALAAKTANSEVLTPVWLIGHRVISAAS